MAIRLAKPKLGVSLLALIVAATTPAHAQGPAASQPTEPQTAADESPNDILVTARRVEERLQDVPIAVSALTTEDLQRQAIDDLGDVAEKTVGFAFETFTGPLAQPVIRGQTNLRTTSPVQNVATYLNGIYLQRAYFVDQSLLDLERVEIIKGPQSALYGRNAFAGVINLVARGADLDNLSGSVSGTVGTHDRYDAKASLNFPIIPGKLAVFGSAAHSQFDGTWRNNHPLANADGAFTKGRLGGWNKEAYQVGATARLADVITLEGLYVRTERELESNPSYTLSTAGLTYALNSLNASPRAFNFPGVGGPLQNRLWVGKLPTTTSAAPGETRLPGLVVDPRSYGLRGPTEIIVGRAELDTGGPITLQYLFGRTTAKIIARGSSARDPLAPTIVQLAPTLPPVNFGTIFDASGTDSSFESNSHEGRATFKASDRISGFVGVNFTTTRDIESNASEFAPVNSLVEPNPQSRFAVGPGLPIPTTLTFRRTTFLERRDDVFSAFAFIDIRPTDQLAITLEGRYTDEDIDAADLIAPDVPPNNTRIALNTPRTSRSSNYFTPRGTISYKFTEDSNVYASVARGVKSGGINGIAASFNRIVNPVTGAVTFQATSPGTLFSPAQQFYEPETNWTYEIGTKNSLMDGRLQLNLAAYYTDWKNLQTNAVRLQPDGTPPNFTAIVPSVTGNVGDVKVYGIEVEGLFRIADPLRVNFGASYNRARYKDDVVSQRFGASGNCNGTVCSTVTVPGVAFPVLPIGGNQLERTPEFDALLGLTYETEFANGWEFFARGDMTYQTKQYADEANLAYVPSRTLANASTGVTIGPVSVQLWVKNLFDKKYVTSSLFLIGTAGQGSASYVPLLGERRTGGLTASFRF